MPFDPAAARRHVTDVWDRDILPALADYIRIPNESPAFDPDWAAAGHMERAVALVEQWCAARPIEGATVEVVALDGRTPVVLVDVPPSPGGADTGTVLLYGHLDKQPPMLPWRDGLGPWEPVRDGDRLYGRGGADDGYAVFASLAAVEAVVAAGGTHGRCVVLIEASEESGSPDLPAYVDHLAGRIGTPDLVVCLDSGAGDYERLWVSTSLRGMVGGTLRVDVLRTGVHSGMTGGSPDSFRIVRALLDRVEDAATGRVLLADLHVDIPDERRAQIGDAAAVLGEGLLAEIPSVPGATALDLDATTLLERRTWHPSLTVVGAGGLPETGHGGNVLRPYTEVDLSFRLPPGVGGEAAAAVVETALTADAPPGARITWTRREAATGWNAPATAPWLASALDAASRRAFGAPPVGLGIGGTIPFMAMLGERFPDAQFVVTGVLGPGSNAHGPNEFLHVPYATRLTEVVASVIDAHATRTA